jgi:hypothetical protein
VEERTLQPENIAYASSSKVDVKTDAQKLHSLLHPRNAEFSAE